MEKPCKDCGDVKPLTDFYRHPGMNDGHLGSCKECRKAYALRHRQENLERVQEYDRERGQLPHRKEANKKRAPRYKEKKKHWGAVYNSEHPDKARARSKVARAIRAGKLKPTPCERCGYFIGVHAHHEDYSKPLDVNWLCNRCHGERHREINEERRRRAA